MRLSTTTTILSNNDPTAPEESVFRAMRLCKQAGFVHLDMNFHTQAQPGYPLAANGWQCWVEKVLALSQELGVTFYQAHAFHYITRESTSDKIDRPWYEERIRRSILAAKSLGVRWIVQHPSDFDADDVYDFDKARRYNLDYWSPFVDFAPRNGVGFAFENMFQSGHHERYCSQVEELIDLVDAFKDPRVGVCWDTGHASVAGQDQSAAIRMLGHRLKATHIHDNHGLPYGDEHLTPYFGSIAWKDILQALGEIGYDGNFSFEIKHASQPLPPQLCADMLRFLYAMGGEMVACAKSYLKECVKG